MANAFYVYIEAEKQGKIDGDVDQEGREDLIRGYAFSQSTTIPRHKDTGQPVGNRMHHPIIFTKHVDKSSPLLWSAMTRGERLKKVRFDFYEISSQGSSENYYSITLTNAVIVQMQTDMSDTSLATGTKDEPIREHLHLTYQRIDWEHKTAGTAAADDWKKPNA